MSSVAQVQRVEPNHPDFLSLVTQLDAFLAGFDGPDHSMYSGFNKLDSVKGAVVAYLDDEAVGCGAFRILDSESGEVKRMFVPPAHRSKGIARSVLNEIEEWCRELGVVRLQLETGAELESARRLYESNGYSYIPNYEPYVGLDRSVCLAKTLV